MATCATCTNDAIYAYQPGPEFSIYYCQYHLPRFLTRSDGSSVFPVVKEEPKTVEPKVSKKKEAAAPAEAPAE